MKKRWKLLPGLLAVSTLLSGCLMKTVDEMYRLPRRSEEYNNLQAAIDSVMTNLEYCAPLKGENQQTIQLADLTGDGQAEALLFAKGSGEQPLKIFVFAKENGDYQNIFTIETAGTAFEQVEYADIDDIPGLDLVVGRQVGKEVLHSLSVYSFGHDRTDTILTTGYTRFLAINLDSDPRREIFVLRPGAEASHGAAELYDWQDDRMERSTEAPMSVPVEQLKRVTYGNLCPGTRAIFAASAYNEETILTDIYAEVDGRFTNISMSADSGTSVKTVRNYYVYADDIDNDGLMELPSQVEGDSPGRQSLLRWYNLSPYGEETDKVYTCHNYVEHWYMTLDADWMSSIRVTPGRAIDQFQGNVFSLGTDAQILFTVYAFTGTNRDRLAESGGRILLEKSDEVTYSAEIGPEGLRQQLSAEELRSRFHFIQEDWRTGES